MVTISAVEFSTLTILHNVCPYLHTTTGLEYKWYGPIPLAINRVLLDKALNFPSSNPTISSTGRWKSLTYTGFLPEIYTYLVLDNPYLCHSIYPPIFQASFLISLRLPNWDFREVFQLCNRRRLRQYIHRHRHPGPQYHILGVFASFELYVSLRSVCYFKRTRISVPDVYVCPMLVEKVKFISPHITNWQDCLSAAILRWHYWSLSRVSVAVWGCQAFRMIMIRDWETQKPPSSFREISAELWRKRKSPLFKPPCCPAPLIYSS